MGFGGNGFLSELPPQVATAWLADDHRPRFVVRPDATELWSNQGAQRFLSECPSVNVAGGVVRLLDHKQDAQFQAFLKALDDTPRAMALKFQGEDSYCVFRGRRALPGWCCIEVRFSSANYPPTLLDFDHVFGLTSSEAKTANALYGGLSAQEIAATQRITVSTVRTHIRQIYAKIGVSGREQLFRHLDAFRVD